MRILALDLGTKTGWAFGVAGPDAIGGQLSGVADFSPKRYEGGGMRFVRFTGWLHDVLDTLAVNRVYFEEVRRYASTDAANVYAGLMSHLQYVCEQRSIPYAGVPVGTIKKHATGKGNASKEEVIEAVKRFAWNPKDDNEADAIALLLWAVWGQ